MNPSVTPPGYLQNCEQNIEEQRPSTQPKPDVCHTPLSGEVSSTASLIVSLPLPEKTLTDWSITSPLPDFFMQEPSSPSAPPLKDIRPQYINPVLELFHSKVSRGIACDEKNLEIFLSGRPDTVDPKKMTETLNNALINIPYWPEIRDTERGKWSPDLVSYAYFRLNRHKGHCVTPRMLRMLAPRGEHYSLAVAAVIVEQCAAGNFISLAEQLFDNGISIPECSPGKAFATDRWSLPLVSLIALSFDNEHLNTCFSIICSEHYQLQHLMTMLQLVDPEDDRYPRLLITWMQVYLRKNQITFTKYTPRLKSVLVTMLARLNDFDQHSPLPVVTQSGCEKRLWRKSDILQQLCRAGLIEGSISKLCDSPEPRQRAHHEVRVFNETKLNLCPECQHIPATTLQTFRTLRLLSAKGWSEANKTIISTIDELSARNIKPPAWPGLKAESPKRWHRDLLLYTCFKLGVIPSDYIKIPTLRLIDHQHQAYRELLVGYLLGRYRAGKVLSAVKTQLQQGNIELPEGLVKTGGVKEWSGGVQLLLCWHHDRDCFNTELKRFFEHPASKLKNLFSMLLPVPTNSISYPALLLAWLRAHMMMCQEYHIANGIPPHNWSPCLENTIHKDILPPLQKSGSGVIPIINNIGQVIKGNWSAADITRLLCDLGLLNQSSIPYDLACHPRFSSAITQTSNMDCFAPENSPHRSELEDRKAELDELYTSLIGFG